MEVASDIETLVTTYQTHIPILFIKLEKIQEYCDASAVSRCDTGD
jgi:hypothetical protein